MSRATICKTEWMNPGEAARLLGISPNTLKRFATRWGIRIRTLPGLNRRKVNRADVSRVLRELSKSEGAAVASDVPERAAATAGAPAVRRKTGTARPR